MPVHGEQHDLAERHSLDAGRLSNHSVRCDVAGQAARLLAGIRWNGTSGRQLDAFMAMRCCGTVDQGMARGIGQLEQEDLLAA